MQGDHPLATLGMLVFGGASTQPDAVESIYGNHPHLPGLLLTVPCSSYLCAVSACFIIL
jgi:hypothetical protein